MEVATFTIAFSAWLQIPTQCWSGYTPHLVVQDGLKPPTLPTSTVYRMFQHALSIELLRLSK